MFFGNLFPVKQYGAEDTEMNRTGPSPEGVCGPPGEQKQAEGHWEERDTGRERDRRWRVGRDSSQLRAQGQF